MKDIDPTVKTISCYCLFLAILRRKAHAFLQGLFWIRQGQKKSLLHHPHNLPPLILRKPDIQGVNPGREQGKVNFSNILSSDFQDELAKYIEYAGIGDRLVALEVEDVGGGVGEDAQIPCLNGVVLNDKTPGGRRNLLVEAAGAAVVILHLKGILPGSQVIENIAAGPTATVNSIGTFAIQQ